MINRMEKREGSNHQLCWDTVLLICRHQNNLRMIQWRNEKDQTTSSVGAMSCDLPSIIKTMINRMEKGEGSNHLS
ncbi:hypothetical protein BLNAU_3005 [Blattamonas nauphoetae]|uniref:Uncharacterized protein n=1 Tax=Blattamonas nauphoetae TaxID=2049346 RepID=A0ABQ9YDV0_9EUKA|nr:hypothetical protein BLNAU_3005 [Blattamonas nauphoetae]